MSEIRATTISDAAGTGPITLTKQSAAKAWVNFNGTGTIAARDSFNVSSLTDNGTGDYTVNFTSSFSSTNFGVVASAKQALSTSVGSGNVVLSSCVGVFATGSARVLAAYTTTAVDCEILCLSSNGDLA